MYSKMATEATLFHRLVVAQEPSLSAVVTQVPLEPPPQPSSLPCQCEHITHFGDTRVEHPTHKYGAHVGETRKVRTIYGTFNLCLPCADELPKEYLA